MSQSEEFFDDGFGGARKTRTKKRKSKNKNNNQNYSPQKNNLELSSIVPKTENQKKVFDSYKNGRNLLLNGIAGCGKSFLSVYLSLDELLQENGNYQKLIIIRSVLPTRDMGFLPGSIKEKSKIYESPYYAICGELFRRDDAYEVLKQKDFIEFTTSSFLRGMTFRNSIIFIDEFQNMTLHEFASVITRIGDNCKLIVCGDFTQSDHKNHNEKVEVNKILNILKNMKSIDCVNFTKDDIQRNKLVKEFIIARENYENNGKP